MRRPAKVRGRHADTIRAYQRVEAERARLVEQAIGSGVICDVCGATLATFDAKCSAPLDKRCPGFDAIDRAKAAAIEATGSAS